MAEPLFNPPAPPTPPATPTPPPSPTPPPGPGPAGFTTQGTVADPTTRSVQKNETVSGQLEDLFKADSPVLTAARESGVRQAAGRGLQNASFGVQLGENAVISKATEIAGADAQTYGKTASENMNASNQFGLQKAGSLQRKDEAGQKFGFDTALSKQSFEQSGALSEQGFRQAELLSERDFQESLGELERSFVNNKALSAQEQQELLQQMTVESQFRVSEMGERANLDRVQSQLDQAEALQFEAIRNDLELVRMSKASELQKEERIAELQNKLQEIAASAGAQLTLNREQDARRLELTYMQESGAMLRQAMQDIAAVSSTQGISVSQQQGAVADIRAKLTQDLNLIRSLYSQSGDWRIPGGEPGATENPLPPATTPEPYVPFPYQDPSIPVINY